MLELGAASWAVLIAGAAVAGWIDAIIGGGGLILIPLLLAVCPGLAPASALATNKVAGFFGTSSAAIKLSRHVPPPRGFALRFVPVALVAAGAGALVASSLSREVMRPIIIVLLLVVGVIVASKPQFGTKAGAMRPRLAFVLAAAIALYDGAFGPGTGMFLLLAFSSFLGANLLQAAPMAKVVNAATNLGALCVFIIGGHVWWSLGLVLALANICGAQLGARTVLRGGDRLLRIALLVTVVVMSVVLAIQQWG
ncbi:TSUP family transporter [Corynebacterium pelargi]|uniref:Probable membrane transporter protein n=1 Tax=Corynebacterium pelargi TaxID=1471400 RepID=A0A410W5X7_9CORY|nr:TSUP family transporter [Corynebacterium pelargi]QAU51362.1 hypothetical protein CPELA_00290 [Corynebacterium pelargi]GGG81462.1 UPF0721 transmembrane protein [Corynebacterium pelargi]